MDKIAEQKIVSKFIVREKRKRILYELFNPKKREQVIHSLINYLDERYVVLNDLKISEEEFLKQANMYVDRKTECYVIADSCHDGKIMSLKTAIKNMFESCTDYLIFCNESVLLIKEEFVFKGTAKMILVNSN